MLTWLLTERRRHMLTGAISALLLVAAASIGIKAAFGAFAGGYELVATFDAAGQGLIAGSDVKVRGVNVGEVRRVELVDGEAVVTMRMFPGEEVPRTTAAEIRPKTLFGEKFVHLDPGDDEGVGPALADGDEITETRGGFELEQVLTDTFPLLQAIDPAKVGLVVGELADAGAGMGDTVNRTIVNSQRLAEVQADNLDNVSQFLRDLAALSDELAGSADDLLAGARDLNLALPDLVAREDQLIELLEQTSRLSNDASDLLLANRGFLEAVNVDGSRTVQALFDQREQVVPLVVGLRQYVQSLTTVARIEVGDGTLMAAVKGFIGSEACELLPCNPGLVDDLLDPVLDSLPIDSLPIDGLPLGGAGGGTPPVPGSGSTSTTAEPGPVVPGSGRSGAEGIDGVFRRVLGR